MQDVFVCVGQRTRNLLTDEDWRAKVQLVLARLGENERRWVAALLSQAVGWGGRSLRLGGDRARSEDGSQRSPGTGQRPGGLSERSHSPRRSGAAAGGKNQPTIEQDLKQLVEPEAGGDATDKRKYVKSSLRSLAKRLGASVIAPSGVC